MSEVKENEVMEEQKEWKSEGGELIWALVIFAIFFGSWGSSENSRISELEKKVARLEGQMSMIGGKSL